MQEPKKAEEKTTVQEIYSGELQFRSCMYENGKLQSGRPTLRWCALLNDYCLYIKEKKSAKFPVKVLPLPGMVILYGEEELKSDSVVPNRDYRKVPKFIRTRNYF